MPASQSRWAVGEIRKMRPTFMATTPIATAKTSDLIVPDKQSEPIMLKVDRNGDGRADVVYFDFQRRGKWDLSLWSENNDGHWTLVGYHDDGTLTPSRFESYEAFQQRRQAQR